MFSQGALPRPHPRTGGPLTVGGPPLDALAQAMATPCDGGNDSLANGAGPGAEVGAGAGAAAGASAGFGAGFGTGAGFGAGGGVGVVELRLRGRESLRRCNT